VVTRTTVGAADSEYQHVHAKTSADLKLPLTTNGAYTSLQVCAFSPKHWCWPKELLLQHVGRPSWHNGFDRCDVQGANSSDCVGGLREASRSHGTPSGIACSPWIPLPTLSNMIKGYTHSRPFNRNCISSACSGGLRQVSSSL
jgi:hypothetical protein